MPEFNQLLAQRFNRLATRLFGLEEAPGVGAVGPELIPVAVLHADSYEDGIHRGERHCTGRVILTTGVATFAHIALTIPATLDMLARITDIYFQSSNANDSLNFIEKGDAVALATAEFGFLMDPRGQSNPSSAVAGRLSSVLAAAGAGTVWATVYSSGSQAHHWSRQGALYVVSPGRGVLFRTAAFSATIDVTIRWTERPCRPEERDG